MWMAIVTFYGIEDERTRQKIYLADSVALLSPDNETDLRGSVHGQVSRPRPHPRGKLVAIKTY